MRCIRQVFQEQTDALRDKALAELEVTEEARGVAYHVLYPVGHLPWFFKPLFGLTGWLTRAVTIELMPESTRRGFGLSSTKFTRTTNSVFLVAQRLMYPWTPRPIRHGFKNYYMADFRSRVKRGKPL